MTGEPCIPHSYVNHADEMSGDSRNYEHHHAARSHDLWSMHHSSGPVDPTTTVPTDYHNLDTVDMVGMGGHGMAAIIGSSTAT